MKNIIYIKLLFFVLFFALHINNLPASVIDIFPPQLNKDTVEINRSIESAQDFYKGTETNYDSALLYLNKALDLSLANSDDLNTYRIYYIFADLLTTTRNNTLAIDYYFRMLQMLDNKGDKQTNADMLNEYSVLYRHIGTSLTMSDIDKSLDYYMKGLQFIEDIEKIDPDYPHLDENRFLLYNNIGASYIDIMDYEKAFSYLEKVLSYPAQIDKSPYYASSVYNNLGITSWELGKYEEAIEYHNKSFALREQIGDQFGMSTSYYNMGQCHYLQGDLSKALEKYGLALQISKESGNTRIEMYAAEALAQIHEARGNYKEMADMLFLSNNLKDSIANTDKINDIARIELQYLLEKQLRESELKQQIIISEKERKELVTIFIFILLFFLLMVLFLLYNIQRTKNKKSLLEKESLFLQNENLELKNQQLKQKLDNKIHELNTHMKYLLKKNEFVTSVMKNVSDIKDENQENIKTVMNDIKQDIESSVWNEFNVIFQDMHQDFYNKLYLAHPALTSNEKKLCAFIRLNMSTKEISAVTFQSPKTLEIARSRLRKKLNLQRNENLNLYLSQF